MPNELNLQTPVPTEPVAHWIRQVSASDAEGLRRVSALHMELLDFGPMAQFGDEFIRRICYAIPVREGLLHLAIAEVGDQPVGFIAYTDRAKDFHRAMFRKHLVEAGWLIGLSLLQRPQRVLQLPRAMKVVLSRDNLPKDVEEIQAEVVSVGVRPDFLTPAFVRRTGLRIGLMLLNHAIDHFRSGNHKRVRMIVDADNRRALLFYHTLGASFTPCSYGGVDSLAVSIGL